MVRVLKEDGTTWLLETADALGLAEVEQKEIPVETVMHRHCCRHDPHPNVVPLHDPHDVFELAAHDRAAADVPLDDDLLDNRAKSLGRGRRRWRWPGWSGWPAARARRALGRSLRPAELRLDGIDPCALLAAAQVRQLETRGGRCTEQQADEPGGAGCRWPNPQGERP